MRTGAELVGPVPNGWSVAPLKRIVAYNTETLPESTDPDWQFDYVEISDVAAESGITRRSTVQFGEAPSRARRIARRGDVLVSTVRTYLRAVAPVEVDHQLVVSTGFAVLRPTESVNESFLKYLCLSEPFLASTIAHSTGVSYPAINASDLVQIHVAVPPATEQREIGNFLDGETAKIDALIAKQEQLIATLREDRTATITHAVTKGLNADVEMQESGVPWIGYVPRHWAIRPIASVSKLVQTGPFGSQLHASDYVDGGVPIINPSHIDDTRIRPSVKQTISEVKASELARHRLRQGDIVAARRGELGRSAVVDAVSAGYLCGTGSLLIRLDETQMKPGYFQRFFSSHLNRERLSQISEGSTMDNLSASMVARLRVCRPPVREQSEIARFLEDRCATIDGVVIKAEAMIGTLREYRSTLITNAVTGKIDVRGAA